MTVNPDQTSYCLYIEVLDSNPPIWRRFLVPPHLTLAALHSVLAAVMGWSGTGDYRFKGSQEKVSSDIQAADPRISRLQVADLVQTPGDSFLYTYNQAQGWIHKVTLEVAPPPDPESPRPYCLEGEQACPPEFCVGIWGYEELIDRLNDPDDPDYDALWEQVGYDFDPARFDLPAVNQRLGNSAT